MNDREVLKVDTRPRKLRIESEPYVKVVGSAYVAMCDVYEVKTKREYVLAVNAWSISSKLIAMAKENNDELKNLEFWINKESDDKRSKYEVSPA